MAALIALLAGAIVVLGVYLGRRDLTRPAVVFAVVFFGFAAAAQLQLTALDRDWSTGFAALTVGGGIAFIVAALLASGTRGARGTLEIDPRAYRSNRVLVAAALLIIGAIIGWSYKSTVLDGIPLLSGEADITRARAVEQGGEVAVPAWSSALTGGFHLAFWCLLASLWSGRGIDSGLRRFALGTLSAIALFGVALEASRNLVLLAVGVPLIAAYVLSAPARRAGVVLRVAAVSAIVFVVVGGAFIARLEQTGATNSANQFVKDELRRQPVPLKPLIPVYVNGVLPFVGYQGAYEAIPRTAEWGYGGYSLTSFPDVAFPEGKPDLGSVVRTNMPSDRYGGFWTVATYQGRAYGDAGPVGVIGVSVLLGLLFGGLYRWARGRAGLLAPVLIGYGAYYTAYMAYDNLLSFTLIAFYDIAVIAGVERYVRRGSDHE